MSTSTRHLAEDQPTPALHFGAAPGPTPPPATPADTAALNKVADTLAAIAESPTSSRDDVRSACRDACHAFNWYATRDAAAGDIWDALMWGDSPSACNVWGGAVRAAACIRRLADKWSQDG